VIALLAVTATEIAALMASAAAIITAGVAVFTALRSEKEQE